MVGEVASDRPDARHRSGLWVGVVAFASASLLTIPGVPGTGERVLVGEVASDRPGARHRSGFWVGVVAFASASLLTIPGVVDAGLRGRFRKKTGARGGAPVWVAGC